MSGAEIQRNGNVMVNGEFKATLGLQNCNFLNGIMFCRRKFTKNIFNWYFSFIRERGIFLGYQNVVGIVYVAM